jgi:uncharacterized repeat protein (TIGR03803 family)
MTRKVLLCLTVVLGVNFFCGAERSAAVGNKDEVALITVATFGANEGPRPVGSLALGADGAFYGVTQFYGASAAAKNRFGNGSVFRVTTNGILTTLFSFRGTNGSDPMTGLTAGNDGKLYGVTYAGGTNSGGVAFCVSTNGEQKVLHYFGGGEGWDYSIRKTPGFQHWQGGCNPIGGLLRGNDGNFYGTTAGGGLNFGTVFKMNPGGQLTYIFTFDSTNGERPSAELARDAQGNLYGTTEYGGPNGRSHGGYGTVFKINPAGQLIWSVGLAGTNGLHPLAGLAIGRDGNFYGSTYGGWYTLPKGEAFSDGTIFKITTNGVLTTLMTFANTNGACPIGRLILASDGDFYGATRFLNGIGRGSDEALGSGALFRMTPGGTLGVLTAFGGENLNTYPAGGLAEGPDGYLYGVVCNSGTNNATCVFKFKLPGSPGKNKR